jgi:hypothetical protein
MKKGWRAPSGVALLLAVMGLTVFWLVHRGWPGVPRGAGYSEVVSPSYPLDGKVVLPLQGPAGSQRHLLVRDHPAELLWVTGCSVSLSDPQGTALPQGSLASADVDLANLRRHQSLRGGHPVGNGRLFGLSSSSGEVRLPVGFGLPMLSSEPLLVSSALMNLDPSHDPTEAVVRTRLEFVYQRGLKTPMVALWTATASALVSLDQTPTYYGLKSSNPLRHGPGCSVLSPVTELTYQDPLRQTFAADWWVPPSQTVTTRTLVTRLLNLPYDTTLHLATGQALPGVQRLQLVDQTGQKVLVTLDVEPVTQAGSPDPVPGFRSLPGVPMYAQHDYELLVTCHNSGSRPLPAKAAMILYLRDREYSVAEQRLQ